MFFPTTSSCFLYPNSFRKAWFTTVITAVASTTTTASESDTCWIPRSSPSSASASSSLSASSLYLRAPQGLFLTCAGHGE